MEKNKETETKKLLAELNDLENQIREIEDAKSKI